MRFKYIFLCFTKIHNNNANNLNIPIFEAYVEFTHIITNTTHKGECLSSKADALIWFLHIPLKALH